MDRDFPESVERFYSEEFKQKLAISFLNSSILTDEMIQIRLNNGKVEEWKVELTVLEEKAMVDLSFLTDIFLTLPLPDHRSQTLIILSFLFCNSIACN